ncbi:MAG: GNAT family protein [Pseudomonadota bacterium]
MPSAWSPPPYPARRTLEGRFVRLEPLDHSAHADDLWDTTASDKAGTGWTYMVYGPFDTPQAFDTWLKRECGADDTVYFAFVAASSGRAVGWGSYLRIAPDDGSIEVGSIQMSLQLQRTTMATEALHLMIDHVFALGYRRCEWKCDALNAASRRAAERLGFSFEGVFRQATHYKGRNRDTAWYAIVDHEWPRLAAAHTTWLDPMNFDADGNQVKPLSALIAREFD